jgi:hypothetical protein
VLLVCAHGPEPTRSLALTAFYAGGIVEPFLDAVTEVPPMFDFLVGQAYYVETFGKFFVGRVSHLTGTTVTLDQAAWVAQTGRYSEFLAKGRADGMEVEPMGDGLELSLAYISVKRPWPHKLFKEAV